MAISREKVWIDGEELTAADLNGEFDNIRNNATSLISPLTGNLDIDGKALTMDAAGVTTLVSSSSVGLAFTAGAKEGTPSLTTPSLLAMGVTHGFRDTATAASGTATAYAAVSIPRPTLTAANTSVTTTDAATLYITHAPLASTNQTLTNSWALWVDDGASRFDGQVRIANNTKFVSRNAAGNGDVDLIYANASNNIVVGMAAARLNLAPATTSRVHIPVVATASLPTGAAAEDGSIIIEDNGAGDRNLIIYGGGQRFRIDGGAAV
jgi:hypothetical protein